MKKFAKVLVLAAASAHLAVAPLAYSTPSFAQSGDVALPAPYISHALDAVLLPVDDAVRSAFGLDAAEQGVLVLAVAPGGIADSQGIEPGDVITQVQGHTIADPIDLDEIVYYWILQGNFDFAFDYYRAGVLSSVMATITLELYETVIDVATISSWSAWSVEGFSYEEFYEEYSVELTESYESSETLIEETVTSEEYSEEFSTETEDVTEDSDGDGIDDAEDTDDDGDGVDDADEGDDDAGDDGSEDDGGDDEGGDDGDE